MALDHRKILSKNTDAERISDYLSERRQSFFIGSLVSESKYVCWCPSRVCFRPLFFFLIYVNDIAENLLLSITRLFADDTSLAFSSSDVKDTKGILNHDLRMIAS